MGQRVHDDCGQCAILQLGQIDRDRVFLDKDQATLRATLELNTAEDVVPVIVTGDMIELA